MSCIAYLPNGAVDTRCPMKDVRHIILTNKTFSLSSLSDAYNFATWKAGVDTNLTVYPFQGITDYENTTDDPNILTTGKGRKIVTSGTPTPSGVFYIDTNHCDYMDLLASLKGGQYRVFLVNEDGAIICNRTEVGAFRGFTAEVTAMNKGFTVKGEHDKQFPVYINFMDSKEWELAAMLKPAWSFELLIDATPAGLTMSQTSACLISSVTVFIADRCGNGLAGFVAADFDEVSSNYLTTPAVATVTDGGAGVYTLTLTKGSAAALAVGDYIEIRVKKVVSTVVTYLSNKIVIKNTTVA